MNSLDQAKMSDQEKLSPDPDSASIPLMSSTDHDDRESEPHAYDDDHQNPPKKSSPGRRHNIKLKVVLEVVVLIFFLVFLWAVYAVVPTVFYVLKPILQVCSNACCG